MDKNRVTEIRQKVLEKGIKLNPVIPIETVREYEKHNGIVLPEELVAFYTLIGNGGIMLDGFPLKSFEELKIDIEKVKEEFPFTTYWVWEDGDEHEEGDSDDVYKGNIELIDIGCGQTWNIIVTGKERGQMWDFTDVGIQPCAPKRTFLSWYEYWLDGNDYSFEEFE